MFYRSKKVLLPLDELVGGLGKDCVGGGGGETVEFLLLLPTRLQAH
jgi:hypothetical protein